MIRPLLFAFPAHKSRWRAPALAGSLTWGSPFLSLLEFTSFRDCQKFCRGVDSGLAVDVLAVR